MYSIEFLQSFYIQTNDLNTTKPTSNRAQSKKLPQVLYKCRLCCAIVDSVQDKMKHRAEMHSLLAEGATLFDSYRSKDDSKNAKPKKKMATSKKGKTQAKPKPQPKNKASGVKKAKGKTAKEEITVTISKKYKV